MFPVMSPCVPLPRPPIMSPCVPIMSPCHVHPCLPVSPYRFLLCPCATPIPCSRVPITSSCVPLPCPLHVPPYSPTMSCCHTHPVPLCPHQVPHHVHPCPRIASPCHTHPVSPTSPHHVSLSHPPCPLVSPHHGPLCPPFPHHIPLSPLPLPLHAHPMSPSHPPAMPTPCPPIRSPLFLCHTHSCPPMSPHRVPLRCPPCVLPPVTHRPLALARITPCPLLCPCVSHPALCPCLNLSLRSPLPCVCCISPPSVLWGSCLGDPHIVPTRVPPEQCPVTPLTSIWSPALSPWLPPCAQITPCVPWLSPSRILLQGHCSCHPGP